MSGLTKGDADIPNRDQTMGALETEETFYMVIYASNKSTKSGFQFRYFTFLIATWEAEVLSMV